MKEGKGRGAGVGIRFGEGVRYFMACSSFVPPGVYQYQVCIITLYFPGQLVRGLTLSDLQAVCLRNKKAGEQF